MNFCAAKLFHRHLFSEDFLDHRRPGDEHLARALDHDDEVGQRRRIGGDADARSHDRRELRNHARGDAVLKENFSDGGGDRESFLDPGADGVVETDQRDAELACGLDDVSDLFGVGAADGSGEHGAILGKKVNRPAVDFAVTGDDAV